MPEPQAIYVSSVWLAVEMPENRDTEIEHVMPRVVVAHSVTTIFRHHHDNGMMVAMGCAFPYRAALDLFRQPKDRRQCDSIDTEGIDAVAPSHQLNRSRRPPYAEPFFHEGKTSHKRH